LVSAQCFSRIKWRGITKMRHDALVDWAKNWAPPPMVFDNDLVR
jgi:hypothetical protein